MIILFFKENKVILLPNKTMKHTKANRPLEPLIYHHYPDNEKLCIVKCLQSYIWIPNTLVMQDIRDIIISLFVTESHTNQCHQRQYLEGLKKKYTTSLHWGWYEISRGIKENSIWNFHTGVTKKNLCGISRGLGFWC